MASEYPYRNFKYRVEIDGIDVAGFSEATIPETSTNPLEYREGTDFAWPRKLSGLVSFGNLTLKRGVTDSMALSDWRRLVEEKGSDVDGGRKAISLILVMEEDEDKARWNLEDCWPIKLETSGFNATNDEVLIDTLEIVLERMTRVS